MCVLCYGVEEYISSMFFSHHFRNMCSAELDKEEDWNTVWVTNDITVHRRDCPSFFLKYSCGSSCGSVPCPQFSICPALGMSCKGCASAVPQTASLCCCELNVPTNVSECISSVSCVSKVCFPSWTSFWSSGVRACLRCGMPPQLPIHVPSCPRMVSILAATGRAAGRDWSYNSLCFSCRGPVLAVVLYVWLEAWICATVPP